MFEEFAGERFFFLVTADGQVLFEILAFLLQPQSQHFLFIGFLPLVGQLALKPRRQLLQFFLPFFLLISTPKRSQSFHIRKISANFLEHGGRI